LTGVRPAGRIFAGTETLVAGAVDSEYVYDVRRYLERA
jgi:hypothetical protein